MYEVLFDEEFLGGLTLRCSPNRAYRLPGACLLNITYGVKTEEMKSLPKNTPLKSLPLSGTSYASATHQSHTPSLRQGHTPSPRLVGGAYHSANGNIQRQPHGPGRGRGFSPGYIRVMSSSAEKGVTPGRTPGRGRGKDQKGVASSTPSRGMSHSRYGKPYSPGRPQYTEEVEHEGLSANLERTSTLFFFFFPYFSHNLNLCIPVYLVTINLSDVVAVYRGSIQVYF